MRCVERHFLHPEHIQAVVFFFKAKEFFYTCFLRGYESSGPSVPVLSALLDNITTPVFRNVVFHVILHYIHYVTLHYITLRCISLHYITLYYIALHHITLH